MIITVDFESTISGLNPGRRICNGIILLFWILQLLSLPYTGYSYLVPECWVKKLWHFLETCKATVHIPGLWIPMIQRKGDRYLMDVARAAGFSVGDQIILREAATILKVHTISNITTLDSITIKKGVVEDILDDRASCYRWPRPMEWDTNHSRVMKSITNRITIASEWLQIHLHDFHTDVHHLQKYTFHFNPSNDTLVEFRPWRVPAVHNAGPTWRGCVSLFEVESTPLSPSHPNPVPVDSHIGINHIRMTNRIPSRNPPSPAPWSPPN